MIFNQIIIPRLQRDYVQGNQRDKIEPFIDFLLAGLESEAGVDLNYVYGIEEGNSFIPIDGQQRMTTLWLLRLYLIACVNAASKAKKAMPQSLLYLTREYAHDFCQALTKHADTLLTPQLEWKDIVRQPWFVDAWRHDTTVKGCLSTLELIHQKMKNRDASTLLNGFDEKIRFAIKTLGRDINDDVYIKMNGRGIPLTEYENLKSWLDKQVEELFEDNPAFVDKWRENMDNAWTDMVWQNRRKQKERKEDTPIDDLFLRLLYTLTYLYWQPHPEGMVEGVEAEVQENVCLSLGIGYPTEKICDELMARMIRREKYSLPLYVLTRLKVFDRGALTFIADKLTLLLSRWKAVNALNLYIWRENPEDKTTRFFQLFLDESLESIPYGKLALCHAVLAYPESALESFEEWMYRMRNLIVNQTVSKENLSRIMASVTAIGQYLSEASFRTLFNHPEQYPIKGFTEQQCTEEKNKANIDNPELQQVVRDLENHPFFVGQVKFMFDFCGETPDKEAFIAYADAMKRLFDENGFAKHYDHWRLRRALLACSTYHGFGYERSSNWNFLYSLEDKKRFISDSTIYYNQPHNGSLRHILAEMVNAPREPLDDLFDNISRTRFETIADWRRYFSHEYVWRYMEQQNIRWKKEGEIYLLKKTRISGEHVEVRTYELYQSWRQSFEDMNGWTFRLWPYHYSYVYLEKKNEDSTVVMEVFHDNDTESCFKLSFFLREGKEQTIRFFEAIQGLPSGTMNDEGNKYVTNLSFTRDEVLLKVKECLSIINTHLNVSSTN